MFEKYDFSRNTKFEKHMPLILPVGLSDPFFVVGISKLKKLGFPLPAGAVATVTSADPLSAIITLDSPPLPTDEDFTLLDGTDCPAGTASQVSGKVSTPAAPAQLNVPVNVTLHLANADGSPVLNADNVAIADMTDTVTVVPPADGLEAEGVLFGKNPA